MTNVVKILQRLLRWIDAAIADVDTERMKPAADADTLLKIRERLRAASDELRTAEALAEGRA